MDFKMRVLGNAQSLKKYQGRCIETSGDVDEAWENAQYR